MEHKSDVMLRREIVKIAAPRQETWQSLHPLQCHCVDSTDILRVETPVYV